MATLKQATSCAGDRLAVDDDEEEAAEGSLVVTRANTFSASDGPLSLIHSRSSLMISQNSALCVGW